MKKWPLYLAALFAAYWSAKAMTFNLRHFKASEFGPSLPFLSQDLLLKLDEFRERLGSRVLISPAPGSLLRPASDKEGEHGKGRAADVMIPDVDLKTAFMVAREVGFTGIGVYPHWKPHKGLHLDVRPDRTPNNPALWAGLRDANGKQIYTSVTKGFA